MTKTNETGSATANREIAITRIFNAPRELVYEVWTDPQHIDKWWGPNGFTNDTRQMDVRPGGMWRFLMKGPEGMQFPSRIVYTEVVKPERLVFEHGSDTDNDPDRFHVTVTFTAVSDRQTQVHMSMLFPTAAQRDMVVEKYGAIEGNRQTMDRLEEHLAALSLPAFALVRVVDAPCDLVFRAWTEPERLAQWWGPRGFGMQTQKIDLRPGGVYLYSMTSPEGFRMWGKMAYREVVAPRKLSFVVSFSDGNGGTTRHPMSETWPLEVLNSITLEEQDGKTLMTLKGWPLTGDQTERDTFNAGFDSMQQGFAGTLSQLDAYLAAQQ